MGTNYKSYAETKRRTELQEKAMHLRFQGRKYREIASLLGQSEKCIKHWFGSRGPLHKPYKDFCGKLLDDKYVQETKSVAVKIKDEAPRSLDTVVELRDNKKVNPEVRYRCSADILDRAGYAPITKTANVHVIDDMGADELNQAFGKLVDGLLQKGQ